MPGWGRYSTWGYEHGTDYWAQLYRNTDDRDGEPRIWITPASHLISSFGVLVQVITTRVAHEIAPDPVDTDIIRDYLIG